MNVIANNCIGAMCYKLMDIPYGNPFMWSLVSPVDFIYLVNNFENINFEKIEIVEDNKIRVDSVIDVKFPHYKTGDCDQPTTVDSDVFYNRIADYVVDKWTTRLKRMFEQNEPPVFIISDRLNGTDNGKYCFNNVKLLSNIKSKYYVIFAGVECDIPKLPKNVKFFEVPNKGAPIKRLAEIILEKNKL